MKSALFESALKDVWQHLTSDRQAWLLGAGVSFRAGIPLMRPLTSYVQTLISERHPDELEIWKAVWSQLPDSCHVEHVLSHVGDLIAVGQRSKTSAVSFPNGLVSIEKLRALHRAVVTSIGYAVQYGYTPVNGEQPQRRGSREAPIVTVDDHRAFVKRLFAARAKPGFQQTPIAFFTTNYDTLIEDALALEQVPFSDGFLGGAMAYWSPEQSYAAAKGDRRRANVFKLHGSVDWHLSEEGAVIRCRDGCAYPTKRDNLVIYPQATKYVATQKDPFALLFSHFRAALAMGPDNVLAICGYSFSDEHVDGEIKVAMSQPLSKTVIVAFTQEQEVNGAQQLPLTLRDWLTSQPWRDRVFVVSDRGLYHGSAENLCSTNQLFSWWSFQGVTAFLAEGPEVLPSLVPNTGSSSDLETSTTMEADL